MPTARERIVEAGFGLFMAHGFDGTGLSQILAATGLSKGAFYHHFDSKQALFAEVIATYFPSPFDGMDWAAHDALGAGEQMDAISRHYDDIIAVCARMGGDMTRYYALFFDSLARLPMFRDGANTAYSRLIASLASAFKRERGLAEGAAQAEARRFIARLEGELYLWAVTGIAPNIKES